LRCPAIRQGNARKGRGMQRARECRGKGRRDAEGGVRATKVKQKQPCLFYNAFLTCNKRHKMRKERLISHR